ncbi:MAG: nucleotidyltransferase domain-containing protein [Gammaproteobacteria bacterium]|nr:nucleotidyltransferase domain-containing protein [Gammaproteobacteria bacterium]
MPPLTLRHWQECGYPKSCNWSARVGRKSGLIAPSAIFQAFGGRRRQKTAGFSALRPLVLGTQALYAFEAEAGVHFLLELLASGDIDLLYDTRKRLTLVSDRLDREGLLGLLKKADRSFEPLLKRGFRAANAEGFMVDLIIAPRAMHEGDPVTFAEGDLVAAEVPGLQWLVNSPKLATVAVDETGWPVPMRVPDPRAFALHKAWLSNQADREPLKRQRDLAQARAVAAMVRAHLPHLSFDEALTALHGDVRAMAESLAE